MGEAVETRLKAAFAQGIHSLLLGTSLFGVVFGGFANAAYE